MGDVKAARKPNPDSRVSLFCPYCGFQHIDNDSYAVKPHQDHLCFKCGRKFWISKPTIGI